MGSNQLQSIKNEIQISPAAMQASTALAQVEQSRAVAEVQASLVLARANPRNEQAAEYRIMNSCKRKSLAECASYSFRRGGDIVSGVSIRLAEEIARHWGNMQYGFRELGRVDDASEVEAFAHDLETNVRVTRQFQVRHWRDTRQGGKKITEERDKYELVANMAQRRVRACLLELIPGDIVEAAEEACKATLIGSIGDPKKKIEEVLAAFTPLGVSDEMIEGYLQRKLASIVPADIVNLQHIYRSIRDGVASVDEFFKAEDVANLNARFKGKGTSAAVTGEIVPPPEAKPTTQKEANPSPKPKSKQTPKTDPEKTSPGADLSAKLAEAAQQDEPPHPADEIKPKISPTVQKYMREINQASAGGSFAVDQWRMKHVGRVLKDCGGNQNHPDFLEVRDYAQMTYEECTRAESEAAGQ